VLPVINDLFSFHRHMRLNIHESWAVQGSACTNTKISECRDERLVCAARSNNDAPLVTLEPNLGNGSASSLTASVNFKGTHSHILWWLDG
jgi:hypothetical protein